MTFYYFKIHFSSTKDILLSVVLAPSAGDRRYCMRTQPEVVSFCVNKITKSLTIKESSKLIKVFSRITITTLLSLSYRSWFRTLSR